MGVIRPELCLSKIVTQTDTKPEQHRFQLTAIDIGKASPLDLAEQARCMLLHNGLAVKVMDRMGREYYMIFNFIVSLGTCRFMGRDYRKFLGKTRKIRLWTFGACRRGEIWFALVNSDERIKSFEREEKEGCEQITEQLSALESWKVVL